MVMPAKKRKVMNPRINWTKTETEEFLQTVVNLKDKFEVDMEAKHEVVVSGISGLFPESDDMEELCHHLYNKDDMVTTDSRRWLPGELGVPSGTGKIKSRDAFDYQFFGYGIAVAESMAPLTRIMLEQAFRAVCDSGMSLSDLSGTNTAVYVATSIIETEDLNFSAMKEQGTYSLAGNARTMQPNRISFLFNFKGPSVAMNSCWNGGMEALELAYKSVATGESVAALVGCGSTMFMPHISFHFDAMGRLSKDSATRCFSTDADGYARSEGCVFLFLQRAEHARRSYGSILGVSSMHFGSRGLNFTEFSPEKYKEHLKATYKKAKVDPTELAYFEASGVASKEVDARELNAAADVFLPKRQTPLLIGSIKSNLGHAEGASSLMALTKAIIAMDKGIIPPNLHYKSPNPNIPALVSGKFKVVTESTPLEGDLVGVSSVGIAGAYSHVILKRNPKAKPDVPEDRKLPVDGLPRLVLLSDRLPEHISRNITKLNEMPMDEDFANLMNNLVRDGIRNHMFRGSCVLDGTANKYNQVEAYSPGSTKRPIWFVYSGMGSQWSGMGKALMRLPVFAKAILKCHNVLLAKNMDLIDAITNEDPKTFDNILNAFVGIAAVQIGLTDVLRSVGVEPDGIIGHSLGEQGCAYADGCFTTEEMILSAYCRGKASLDATLIRGMMAAVGIGYQNLKDSLPENVEIACHNSKDGCTLSGPAEDVEAFVAQLKESGVFTKLVNVGNIAFHSKHLKPAGELLGRYLSEAIQEPKQRTSRWISSSVPESQWNTKLAQYSSAEYHVNNMLSPVLFEEASAFIPPDAIVIEIAPHGLLQSILKRSIPTGVHIPLTNRFDGDNLMFLLLALGKLFVAGVPIHVDKLYPAVEYPVSRGTPFLSNFIGWNHKEAFEILAATENADNSLWKILTVDLSEDTFCNLVNHKLGNRFIIPNSFYVDQLVKVFTERNDTKGTGVVIQDLTFDNFCEASYRDNVAITFKVLQGIGDFCVTGERDNILLSKGKINMLDPKTVDWEKHVVELALDKTLWDIDGASFLSFLQYEGLELTDGFTTIKKVIIGETVIKATITWNGNLTEFLNSVFTIVGYCEGRKSQQLVQMKSIRELVIDTLALVSQPDLDIVVEYFMDTKILLCRGIRMVLHETAPFKIESLQEDIQFSCEIPQFIPYTNPKVQDVFHILEFSAQIVLENAVSENIGMVNVIVIGNCMKEAVADVFGSPKYAASFEMTTYSSETEFIEQSSLDSIHNGVSLVVSSIAVGSLYAGKSSARTYILVPDLDSKSEWVAISTFQLEHTSYTLAQLASEVHYEIVQLGAGRSVLEQKLSDANEKNVEENCDNHVVFLTSNINSVSMAMAIIEETSSIKYSHVLRYMLTENSAMDIASYRYQIQRGVRVNVNFNGVWGSLRALQVASHEQNPSDDIYTKVPVRQISSIIPATDVVALGLNLEDPTGSVEDDFIRVFDYVTPMVMGLAKYDQVQNKFVKDEILEFSRPRCWSDTQAATVPVLYSLAAYIVHTVNNQVPDNSILINRGMIPLSQALISLSLSASLDVFVTVFGSEEKKKILQKFPKLKSEQIFDCNTSSFHIPILDYTKGEGVHKVVNTFPDDIMVGACVKCTSIRGTYVQVSKAPMLKNSKMGMLFFDDEVVACGATVNIVMSLPIEKKMEIKDFVNRALLSGHVEPCDNILLLPPSISNIDAAKQMSFVQSKVVVDLNCQSQENLQVFVCDHDGNYVIVGEQPQTYFWLKLTEWLLRRGAKKINVVLKTPTLSPEIIIRLQSLNKEYPLSRIQIHPASRLASKSAIKQFVNDSDSGSNLRTVFLIGSVVKDVSAVLNEVLQELRVQCELVCLGRGGERLSERLNNGLRSISIRCTPAVLATSSFLQRLDGLIAKARKHSVVTADRYSIQRFKDKRANVRTRMHIPATLLELQELSRTTSSKPMFMELPSHCARLSENKECDPVFIFPGLRLGHTRQIASHMTYPVLVAQLPKHFIDIESVASELAFQLASRRQNLFTLIGVEWGGTVALHTASKLQSLGKLATVILLDGAPATTCKWAAKLMADDLVLLSKYTKLPPEVTSRTKEIETWEMKKEALLEFCEPENSQTIEDVSLLRNRLQDVLTAKPPAQKVRILCHLFSYGQTDENDFCGLDEYLKKKPVIHHLKEAASISEMIGRSMDDINSLVLYEHKDAARPQQEDTLGGETTIHIAHVPCIPSKARMLKEADSIDDLI